jgi:hypothetical protein
MALELPAHHRSTGLVDVLAVGQAAPVWRPAELTAHQNVIAENAALRAEPAAAKRAGKGRRRVVSEG